MNTLIIRCPMKPVSKEPAVWDVDDLHFSWGVPTTSSVFQESLDLEQCPIADQVIALIPSIDVRLLELKIPSTSAKKIHQILPMLLDEELISNASDNAFSLLPIFPNEDPDYRLVSLIDRAWLSWLSKKLAALNCEKIQLIPESLLLPDSPTTIFFEQADQTVFYTSKKQVNQMYSWAQPINEKRLELHEEDASLVMQEISLKTLVRGLTSEKKVYEYINLLPQEFYALRKQNHSEIPHWFAIDLWKKPLAWVKYVLITMVVSYGAYFFSLTWLERQWQTTLAQTISQVFARESAIKPTAELLVTASCLVAHKNHETCAGDFERMVMTLNVILNNTPPEYLKIVEYSKEGLLFEINDAIPAAHFDRQRIIDDSVQVLDSTHFLLKPYAHLLNE